MLEIKTNFPIIGVADSAIGGRSENQDDWGYCNAPIGCMILVCDGMGGGPGGKTASGIAKRIFLQEVFTASADADPIVVLQNATASANEEIFEQMRLNPSLQGMGSTFVGVLFTHKAAYTVHCGDSRLYKLRRHSILFRTNDHSLVGQMVRNKTLTEEQARLSPQSNIITRALGNNGNACPDISVIPYEQGDRFVLCTDGIWGIMPQKELVKQFSQKLAPASICDNIQRMVDNLGAAQKGNTHDNHTIAVIDIQTDSKIKEKMSRNTRILFYSLLAILAISMAFNIILLSRKPEIKRETQTSEDIKVIAQNTMSQNNNEVSMETDDSYQGYNETQAPEDIDNKVETGEIAPEPAISETTEPDIEDQNLKEVNPNGQTLLEIRNKLVVLRSVSIKANSKNAYKTILTDVDDKRKVIVGMIESLPKTISYRDTLLSIAKETHNQNYIIILVQKNKDNFELTDSAKNLIDKMLGLIDE